MFKKFISWVLSVWLIITSIAPWVNANFEQWLLWDVPESHSLYPHIEKLVNNGVLTVYSDGSFKPSETVSREQAARYIYNALYKAWKTNLVDKKTTLFSNPFPDVASDDFYAFYIKEMKDLGIMNGYQNGNFWPNNNLSRWEMLAVLENARKKADSTFQVSDYKNFPALIMTNHRFADVNLDNTFFNYIYSAIDNNYIAANNEFRTNDPVSKAELAKLINNILYTPISQASVTDNNNEENQDTNNDTSNQTGLFYKWVKTSLMSDVVISTGSKIEFTIDTDKISPQIAYLDKTYLKVSVDGVTTPIFKITLIKSTSQYATYGIYLSEGIALDSIVEITYSDNYTTINASTEIFNNVKNELVISDENTNEEDFWDLWLENLEDTNEDTIIIPDETENIEDTDTNNEDLDTIDNEDTTEEEDTISSNGDGILKIELSSSTPNGWTIPANLTGMKIASYDLTAVGWNVEVNSLTIKRTWFSDEDTLTWLALFDENGRISKVKDDTQWNDDEAVLTLLDELIIEEWDTKTVHIYISVWDSNDVSWEDFALKVIDANSDAEDLDISDEDGNIFEIAWTEAPILTIKKWTNVSDPQLWDTDIELTKFELEWDDSNDIIVKSITFKAINNDMEDNLDNIVLKYNNEVIAESNDIVDKYITFNFDEEFEVESSKVERFIIHWDIIEWAGDDIGFFVEEKLDIQWYYNNNYSIQSDISVIDTEAEANTITIDAWELTLVDINAEYDEIKEDRNDVVIWELKVSNDSWENIELQEFGVKIVLTPWDAYITGNVIGSLKLAELFEKVELRNKDTGSRYDLTLPTGTETSFVYSDDDLNINLNEWTTNFEIIVDTAKNIEDFNTASIDISLTTWELSATTGWFYAVETTDDNPINDITPSSLSWGKIEWSESSAKASLIPLTSITKVRGADDITILEFELDTDPASSISVEEMEVYFTADGVDATSQEISSVSLYKNSITDNNLLDKVSGSQLQDGLALFDWFDLEIDANEKETFIVTLSIVDWVDAVDNSPIRATLKDITMFDDDNNEVEYLEGDLISWREVNVTSAGILRLEQNVNNLLNEYPKNILAWTLKEKVFSIDIQSDNEDIDIEEISFVIDKDLSATLKSASLYLNGTLIATNSYTDISESGWETTINFPSLTKLIVPQETAELVLALNTNTIWYEKVWETIMDSLVTEINIIKAEGKDSNQPITPSTLAITSAKEFSILPVIVTPNLVSDLDSGQAKIRISIDTWSNTIPTSNTSPQIKLKDLIFTELSSSSDGYSIYKEWQSSRRWVIDSEWQVTLSSVGIPAEAEVTQLTVDTAATSSWNVEFVFNDQTFNVSLSLSDADTNASEIAAVIDASSKYSANATLNVIEVTAVDEENQTDATFTDTWTTSALVSINVTNQWVDFVPYANMSGSDLTISSSTTYVIVPNGTVDKTYSLSLTREGVIYDIVKSDWTVIQADVNTASQEELDLWVKSY